MLSVYPIPDAIAVQIAGSVCRFSSNFDIFMKVTACRYRRYGTFAIHRSTKIFVKCFVSRKDRSPNDTSRISDYPKTSNLCL